MRKIFRWCAAAGLVLVVLSPTAGLAEMKPLYVSDDSGFFSFARHEGKIFGGTYGGGASRVYRFDPGEFVMEHVFPDTESVFRLITPESGGDGVLLANCERNSAGAAPLFRRNDVTGKWEETGVGVVPEDARSMGLGGGYAGGRYWVSVIPYIPGQPAIPHTWNSPDGFSFNPAPSPPSGAAKPFAEYNGSVYTGNNWTDPPDLALYRFAGSSFERVADIPSGGDGANYMMSYRGALFITGSDVMRYDGALKVVVHRRSNDSFFQQLAKVTESATGIEWLYACWSKGWRASGGGAELWRTSNGTDWAVYQTFAESECWALATLFGYDLWAGTREDSGRGRVYHESWGDAGEDAGVRDAGEADGGMPDAGTADAGAEDHGLAEVGVTDAGTADEGFPDAGRDAGKDSGGLDSGVSDVGGFDSTGPPSDAAPGRGPGEETVEGCSCTAARV